MYFIRQTTSINTSARRLRGFTLEESSKILNVNYLCISTYEINRALIRRLGAKTLAIRRTRRSKYGMTRDYRMH